MTRIMAAVLSLGLFGPHLVVGAPADAPPAQTGAASGDAGSAGAQRATERVEQHIADLQRRLAITPGQQPQWEGFANALRQNAQEMERLYQERQARGPLSAADDLRAYAARTRLHSDNVARLVEPFASLYAAFSADQRTAADTTFRDFEQRTRSAPKF